MFIKGDQKVFSVNKEDEFVDIEMSNSLSSLSQKQRQKKSESLFILFIKNH